MTQVLAITISEGIVLAADSHVLVGPPQGPFKAGPPEQKLFVIANRYSALTFGNGPVGDHVPSAIATLPSMENAYAMSQAFLTRFGSPTPPPEMGLLVGGYDSGAFVLFETPIASKKIRQLHTPIVCRGVVNEPTELPGYEPRDFSALSFDRAAAEACRLIHATSALHPDKVGGPVQLAYVTKTGVKQASERM